jgi:hypothetical protein
MKKSALFLTVLLGVFLCFQTNSVSQQATPELVNVGASSLYVPLGFDSNDNAQVVYEGYFPNTCYRTGPTLIEKNGQKVTIQPQAYYHSEACFQMMVHYSHVIDLGILKSGDYQVDVSATEENLGGLLSITPSVNPGTDDYLYAPVKHAAIISKKPTILRLRGEFSNSCMSLKEIVVNKATSDTIAVLPIAQVIEAGAPCADLAVPFVHDVPINQKLDGRYLFHVRSLNGASINTIETVKN